MYHLYLGLLSGGQILAKKRQLTQKFSRSENNEDDVDTPGNALLSFPDHSLHQLKNNLKAIIDEYAKDFDLELRRAMIEESQKVFELNNMIINSVEGVAMQNLKLLGYIVIIVLSIYIFFKMIAL